MNTATVLSLLVSLLSFLWLISEETHGFSVFTLEEGRRIEVRDNPVAIDDFSLISNSVEYKKFSDFKEKYLIVDFIYTNCKSICQSLGLEFKALQSEIEAQGLSGKVGLLSISFDVEGDSLNNLAAYGNKYGAKSNIWLIAKAADRIQTVKVLNNFGVIVIDSDDGEFIHNSALSLVDKKRNLIRIFNHDDGLLALELIKSMNR